LKSFTGAVSTF